MFHSLRVASAFGNGDRSREVRSRAAAVRQEAERPADENEQSVLEADQVPEVHREPGEPGDEAAQPEELDLGDGARASDRGEIAFVVVAEFSDPPTPKAGAMRRGDHSFTPNTSQPACISQNNRGGLWL